MAGERQCAGSFGAVGGIGSRRRLKEMMLLMGSSDEPKPSLTLKMAPTKVYKGGKLFDEVVRRRPDESLAGIEQRP